MYEKNNDKENLLNNEENADNYYDGCNDNDNEGIVLINKNDKLKNNNSFTSLNVKSNVLNKNIDNLMLNQPLFLFRQRSCHEKSVCKYTLCCFYNNYDLNFSEIEIYKKICNDYGQDYNEKLEEHENQLNEILNLSNKIFKEKTLTWRDLGFQVRIINL